MAREIECKIALTEDEFHALYERVCKILLEVKPQVVQARAHKLLLHQPAIAISQQ